MLDLEKTTARQFVLYGAQDFVDLNQYGAAKLRSQWLPWKWQQSMAPNGAQIGLGTDVGSMGICYRRDLMQATTMPPPRRRSRSTRPWPSSTT